MTWHKHTPKWNCISVNGKKRLYKSCPVSYVEVVVVNNNNNNKHKHQPNCPFKLRWPIFCSALLSNSPTGTEKEKSLQHFNESIFSFFSHYLSFFFYSVGPLRLLEKAVSICVVCCLLLLSHRHWFYSRYFFFSNRHTNTNL